MAAINEVSHEEP